MNRYSSLSLSATKRRSENEIIQV